MLFFKSLDQKIEKAVKKLVTLLAEKNFLSYKFDKNIIDLASSISNSEKRTILNQMIDDIDKKEVSSLQIDPEFKKLVDVATTEDKKDWTIITHSPDTQKFIEKIKEETRPVAPKTIVLEDTTTNPPSVEKYVEKSDSKTPAKKATPKKKYYYKKKKKGSV